MRGYTERGYRAVAILPLRDGYWAVCRNRGRELYCNPETRSDPRMNVQYMIRVKRKPSYTTL